ncbi:MAG TPA: hypothetical protein PK052_04900 [Anaerohalosphaeraceae bacterium]|nr:hypothetical protein [Anaerohalosphaeraceae bacterium]HOL31300.1 hypothetical protein [Anaerohalosphaeraceae bacterium]HOM76966.1 hypothetical protein [Anaerohalosphaeraceae bacterium]HPC64754.1 hypothetical protein [Anaerohalosphaeraceae bacterium]HRS71810.1 hypothetical protein [Anaerohalosphaeraceae bacterium]
MYKLPKYNLNTGRLFSRNGKPTCRCCGPVCLSELFMPSQYLCSFRYKKYIDDAPPYLKKEILTAYKVHTGTIGYIGWKPISKYPASGYWSYEDNWMWFGPHVCWIQESFSASNPTAKFIVTAIPSGQRIAQIVDTFSWDRSLNYNGALSAISGQANMCNVSRTFYDVIPTADQLTGGYVKSWNFVYSDSGVNANTVNSDVSGMGTLVEQITETQYATYTPCGGVKMARNTTSPYPAHPAVIGDEVFVSVACDSTMYYEGGSMYRGRGWCTENPFSAFAKMNLTTGQVSWFGSWYGGQLGSSVPTRWVMRILGIDSPSVVFVDNYNYLVRKDDADYLDWLEKGKYVWRVSSSGLNLGCYASMGGFLYTGNPSSNTASKIDLSNGSFMDITSAIGGAIIGRYGDYLRVRNNAYMDQEYLVDPNNFANKRAIQPAGVLLYPSCNHAECVSWGYDRLNTVLRDSGDSRVGMGDLHVYDDWDMGSFSSVLDLTAVEF